MTIRDSNIEQMKSCLNQDEAIIEAKQKEFVVKGKAELRLNYLAKEHDCDPQLLIDWYSEDMDVVAKMSKDELVFLVEDFLKNQ